MTSGKEHPRSAYDPDEFRPRSAPDASGREHFETHSKPDSERMREMFDRVERADRRAKEIQQKLQSRIQELSATIGTTEVLESGGVLQTQRQEQESLQAFLNRYDRIAKEYLSIRLDDGNGRILPLATVHAALDERMRIVDELESMLREFEPKAGIVSPPPEAKQKEPVISDVSAKTMERVRYSGERMKSSVSRLYPYGWRDGRGTRGGHEHIILSFSTGWGREQKALPNVSGNQGAMQLGLPQSIMFNNIRGVDPLSQTGTERGFGAAKYEADEMGDNRRALEEMGIHVQQTENGTRVNISYIPENEYVVIEGEKIRGPVGRRPVPDQGLASQSSGRSRVRDAGGLTGSERRAQMGLDRYEDNNLFNGRPEIRDGGHAVRRTGRTQKKRAPVENSLSQNRRARKSPAVPPRERAADTPAGRMKEAVTDARPQTTLKPQERKIMGEFLQAGEVLEAEINGKIEALKNAVRVSSSPESDEDVRRALRELDTAFNQFVTQAPHVFEKEFRESLQAILADPEQQKEFERVIDVFFDISERLGGKKGSTLTRPKIDWEHVGDQTDGLVKEIRQEFAGMGPAIKGFMAELVSEKTSLIDQLGKYWQLVSAAGGSLTLRAAHKPRIARAKPSPSPAPSAVPGVSPKPPKTVRAPEKKSSAPKAKPAEKTAPKPAEKPTPKPKEKSAMPEGKESDVKYAAEIRTLTEEEKKAVQKIVEMQSGTIYYVSVVGQDGIYVPFSGLLGEDGSKIEGAPEWSPMVGNRERQVNIIRRLISMDDYNKFIVGKRAVIFYGKDKKPAEVWPQWFKLYNAELDEAAAKPPAESKPVEKPTPKPKEKSAMPEGKAKELKMESPKTVPAKSEAEKKKERIVQAELQRINEYAKYLGDTFAGTGLTVVRDGITSDPRRKYIVALDNQKIAELYYDGEPFFWDAGIFLQEYFRGGAGEWHELPRTGDGAKAKENLNTWMKSWIDKVKERERLSTLVPVDMYEKEISGWVAKHDGISMKTEHQEYRGLSILLHVVIGGKEQGDLQIFVKTDPRKDPLYLHPVSWKLGEPETPQKKKHEAHEEYVHRFLAQLDSCLAKAGAQPAPKPAEAKPAMPPATEEKPEEGPAQSSDLSVEKGIEKANASLRQHDISLYINSVMHSESRAKLKMQDVTSVEHVVQTLIDQDRQTLRGHSIHYFHEDGKPEEENIYLMPGHSAAEIKSLIEAWTKHPVRKVEQAVQKAQATLRQHGITLHINGAMHVESRAKLAMQDVAQLERVMQSLSDQDRQTLRGHSINYYHEDGKPEEENIYLKPGHPEAEIKVRIEAWIKHPVRNVEQAVEQARETLRKHNISLRINSAMHSESRAKLTMQDVASVEHVVQTLSEQDRQVLRGHSINYYHGDGKPEEEAIYLKPGHPEAEIKAIIEKWLEAHRKK